MSSGDRDGEGSGSGVFTRQVHWVDRKEFARAMQSIDSRFTRGAVYAALKRGDTVCYGAFDEVTGEICGAIVVRYVPGCGVVQLIFCACKRGVDGVMDSLLHGIKELAAWTLPVCSMMFIDVTECHPPLLESLRHACFVECDSVNRDDLHFSKLDTVNEASPGVSRKYMYWEDSDEHEGTCVLLSIMRDGARTVSNLWEG